MIEALHNENEEMNKAIQRLTEVMPGLCVPGPSGKLGDCSVKEQPMEVGATATFKPINSKPITQEAEDAHEPKEPEEPAYKKRMTERRGRDEISNINARLEARCQTRRLEWEIEKMFASFKTPIEKGVSEVNNTYTVLERSKKLITSHPMFAQTRPASGGGGGRQFQTR